jgi:PAS domain-containing protein
MFQGKRSQRPALFVVPRVEPDTGPDVTFCSHCGERPGWSRLDQAPSRVCEQCGLGLLLEAAADAAPYPGEAFMVLDGSLSVCAVSGAAERLLGTRETDAVNRHVTEFIVPADAEAQGAANLAAAVTWAARGDETARTVTVRPTNTFGIRINARIGGCGPPRAALVVFERGGARH